MLGSRNLPALKKQLSGLKNQKIQICFKFVFLHRFAPECSIDALHGSIMKDEYNRDWFKQFNIVVNALDNRQARNHVNRMCLAADIPLVESGTAGYLGQVSFIQPGYL